jgi:4-aminobutyrate aminotransferase-like enzyme
MISVLLKISISLVSKCKYKQFCPINYSFETIRDKYIYGFKHMTYYMDLIGQNEVPLIRTEIPGPKSKLLLKRQTDLETSTVIYPDSFPIAIKIGNGSIIEDVDGNRFIDWMSGISVLNLGYDEGIRKAIISQIENTWHALEIPTEVRLEFLEKLNNSFPLGMKDYKTIFGISGADACETAVNIAHAVSTKGKSTLGFEGAFHGVSGGIISATSGIKYKTTSYSQGFNMIKVPYPYKLWYKEDISDIIAQMRKIVIDPEAGYDLPNSVIVEPIQGEGGYIVPPQGFLKAIREFCDEFDLTMIVDEVQSGMGRTGKMWAFEWESIKPDIVCVSKSIGGGVPMSLVYYRDDYDKKLQKPFHMGTYRANPLAMAAGSYVLDNIPKYLDRVVLDGKYVVKKFREIDSEKIIDVRGKGFMIGVELGRDRKPLGSKETAALKHKLLSSGLLMHTCGHFGNVFRYMGALNIEKKYLDYGIEIFKNVMEGFK